MVVAGRARIGAHHEGDTEFVGPTEGRHVQVVERLHPLEQMRRHRCDGGLVAEQQLARAHGRHEHGAGRRHLAQRVVVGERAVLDAVDPGVDRVVDATPGVAVRGDVLEVVVRDLDRGAQLVEGELDGARVLGLRRQHRPGRHHLDEVGPSGQLTPRGGPHGVGAVGHLVHPRVVVDRRGGDRQQPACEEHPRAASQALADRVAHRHLHVVPAADVAHGRDAGAQRPLGRGRGVERHRSIAARRGCDRIAGVGGQREVHVAVDQAGQQPRPGHVDHVVIGVATRTRADRRDAPFGDADVGTAHLAGHHVEHSSTHQPAHDGSQ